MSEHKKIVNRKIISDVPKCADSDWVKNGLSILDLNESLQLYHENCFFVVVFERENE